MPEVVETDGDRAAALIEGRVQIHAQARDGRSFDRICGAGRQRCQALLRVRQRAGQELAFGPVQLQREGELVPALPAIFRQQRRTGGEIGERRGVGGRGLGALARDQIELGQLLALVCVEVIKRGAAVELIDDLEDRLLPLLAEACAPRAASRSGDAPRRALLPGSANRRPPERGRGRTGRRLPGARPTPDGRPATEPRATCSSEVPRTIESVVISAMLPRQASCCNAFCVSTGRRVSFPTMRSTTLSV